MNASRLEHGRVAPESAGAGVTAKAAPTRSEIVRRLARAAVKAVAARHPEWGLRVVDPLDRLETIPAAPPVAPRQGLSR